MRKIAPLVSICRDIWKFFWVPRNFEFNPANGIFWQKCKFPAFQKMLFLEVCCRKLTLSKIGVMYMSYIIENKSNKLKIAFPNIFLLISADPSDLFHIKKIIFPKKSISFWSKICSTVDEKKKKTNEKFFALISWLFIRSSSYW